MTEKAPCKAAAICLPADKVCVPKRVTAVVWHLVLYIQAQSFSPIICASQKAYVVRCTDANLTDEATSDCDFA